MEKRQRLEAHEGKRWKFSALTRKTEIRRTPPQPGAAQTDPYMREFLTTADKGKSVRAARKRKK